MKNQLKNTNTAEEINKKLRILVVDDDFDDFYVVNRSLRENSDRYILTHSQNFEDAIIELESDYYDIAIIDYYINDRSAKELLHLIGKNRLKFPIIFLTGTDRRDVEREALDLGAFNFIDKNTFSTEILVRSIDFAIQRYRIEKQLQDTETANRAKSNFLAHMSHELRTPLNAIIGFSEVISGDMLELGMPAQYHEYSSLILNSGRHLLSLVNDLLDLSRIEGNHINMPFETFEVSEVIDNAIALNIKKANERGLTFEIDCSIESMFGDRRLITQVLVNLIANAVKFSHNERPITIRCDDIDNRTVLEVQDYGIGIREHEIEKALSPFQQTESSFYCQGEGNGLGLAISKSLVEAHHGSLNLMSQFGAGTTVRMSFPNEPAVQKTIYA